MKKLAAAGLGLVLALTTWTVADAKGEKATVTGEIIDTFCYATMGAKGPSHKPCAMNCAKKGIPAGLLEKGTDKVYVLLPTKDKTSLPDSVISKMGETATVTGGGIVKRCGSARWGRLPGAARGSPERLPSRRPRCGADSTISSCTRTDCSRGSRDSGRCP